MSNGNRVLAVDDNPTNLAIISDVFEGRFPLKLANDGNEALEIAPTFDPDVVLLDVMMPKPDGFEVCSRMKNHPVMRHSQIIMVSARTDLDDRLRGYRAGADDYVTKPFDEEELLAKVCANFRTRSIYSSIRQQLESLCGATSDVLELVTHLRDSETGEHLERIRTYSHLLAAELRVGSFHQQIDDQFLDDLDRASPLHDIGKIAIPDAILRKPGPLTEMERQQMQQHVLVGESLLNRLANHEPNVSCFRMAVQIARWHHESFDGSGYPDGLIGNAIPLAARIVKVADVFDALTSIRVYKPSLDPQEARQHICVDEADKFDPIVVQAMLNVFDEFVEVSRHPGVALLA
jgi:putative two-component system response regulator